MKREGAEKDYPKQALPISPMNLEVMTRAEAKSQMLNLLSYSGAPISNFLSTSFKVLEDEGMGSSSTQPLEIVKSKK